jgi:HNH endonuclease
MIVPDKLPPNAHLFPEVLIERFYAGIEVKKDTGCWIWKKGMRGNYGNTSLNRLPIATHRLSYELYNGSAEGVFVCHNCPGGDNPACCNPDHLWLGTNRDNILDSYNKGKGLKGDKHPQKYDQTILKVGFKKWYAENPEIRLGEKNVAAKLTKSQVIEIRQLYATGEWSHPTLGKKYGVTHSTIGRIVRGEKWSHVK